MWLCIVHCFCSRNNEQHAAVTNCLEAQAAWIHVFFGFD
jgi:hypothetical protein